MKSQKTLWYEKESERIGYINETLLPAEFRIEYCSTVQQLGNAIRMLAIRGAPALGVAGAFGVALSARTSTASSLPDLKKEIKNQARWLCDTRPTLSTFPGDRRVQQIADRSLSVDELKTAVLSEALKVAEEDPLPPPPAR